MWLLAPARGVRALAPAALLVIAVLAFAPVADATPTATLKVKAIPVPGFPGTGNILGAGSAVEAVVTISGTEYGGFPSPLTGVNVFAPAGLKVSPKGFHTCAPATLEADGAAACPRTSVAGPPGIGLGVVTFGGDRVPESVSIQDFFAPGGGLTFYVEGKTPASFQILEKAYWTTAAAPFGEELLVEVPLIETVPGADDASVTSFKVKVGAAYRKGRKTVSYLTQPKTCPRGGFPVKMELKFMSGEAVTVADDVPCPKR
ncbi:MAG TPA: hypothetical protein VGL68_00720 [Solirubrobacteraceae bacterium]|jgi:hypothetical protein